MNNPMPRVTLAVLAYNQERYIREAIAGALAQDYPNLEIIISDDHSTDRTFEVAQSECRGHERVIVRRNLANLGVAAHVNTIMRIATGELVVAAAGDDISEADRCSAIVAAWLDAERVPDSLCSSVVSVDEHGVPIGLVKCDQWEGLSQKMFGGQKWLIGSSHAWTRRVFDLFGDLPEWLPAEDKVIGFRSAMLGGVATIDRPLVRYRVHPHSISARNSMVKSAKQSHCNLRAHRADIIKLKSLRGIEGNAKSLEEIESVVSRQEEQAALLLEILEEPSRIRRTVRALVRAPRIGVKDFARIVRGDE